MKINGQSYSFANVRVVIDGKSVPVTAVAYKRTRKKEHTYVNSPFPFKRSYGEEEYEASITMLLSDFMDLEADAPFGDVTLYEPFPIVVSWRPTNKKMTKTKQLQSAEFLEHGIDTSQGDMKIEVELPLIISGIIDL